MAKHEAESRGSEEWVAARRAVPAALIGAVAVAATLLLAPGPARACGGFFCDRPAAANPVPVIAQAAENVLFALDRDPQTGAGIVEAHIQIKYTGEADQFSWIVPLTSMPTLSVGSDVLFQVLEPATRPSFTTKFVVDGMCNVPSGGGGGIGCGGSDSAGKASNRRAATPVCTPPGRWWTSLFRATSGPTTRWSCARTTPPRSRPG